MRLHVAVMDVVAIVLASLSPAVTGATSGPFEVFVEPAAGFGPAYSFIGSAKHSLDMTMYELEDPTAEADLAADAARGVDVRVLLDSAYAGAGANKDAAAALSKAGAHVRWARRRSSCTKRRSWWTALPRSIMTANLTSEYYSTSADFLVEDRQPADVATIVRAFDDDWGGDLADSPDQVPVRGQQGDLVFSPGSEGALVGLIESARSSVETSNEEMGSAAVEGALEADARRGVDVEVLMTADSSWDDAFKQLGAAGVHVRLHPDFKLGPVHPRQDDRGGRHQDLRGVDQLQHRLDGLQPRTGAHHDKSGGNRPCCPRICAMVGFGTRNRRTCWHLGPGDHIAVEHVERHSLQQVTERPLLPSGRVLPEKRPRQDDHRPVRDDDLRGAPRRRTTTLDEHLARPAERPRGAHIGTET